MSDAYKVEPPFVVSFSGGRTSGYMLRKVLDAWGGTMPEGGHAIFCNTGREHASTYRFVEEVGKRWTPVTWLEYRDEAPGYAAVGPATASRNGEPFAALIAKRKYLPNPVTRFCTTELKIQTTWKYIRDHGGEEGFTNLVGLRADEPHRVGRMKGDRKAESVICPLYTDGVTRPMVIDFWKAQDFDLELPHGMGAFGNCDLCFLKAKSKILAVIGMEPHLADWWIEQEKLVGATFRIDRPSYRSMSDEAQRQGMLDLTADDSLPCYCHD